MHCTKFIVCSAWCSVYIQFLIHILGEGEIALQEQDISLDHDKLNLPEPLEHSLSSNAIGHRRFKCHICEDSECSLSSICEDAITVKIFYVFYSIQHL